MFLFTTVNIRGWPHWQKIGGVIFHSDANKKFTFFFTIWTLRFYVFLCANLKCKLRKWMELSFKFLKFKKKKFKNDSHNKTREGLFNSHLLTIQPVLITLTSSQGYFRKLRLKSCMFHLDENLTNDRATFWIMDSLTGPQIPTLHSSGDGHGSKLQGM